MDGITATRRIREIERERGAQPTPIIMLSANALPEHVEASRSAGADRHLAKPVSPPQLFAALQAAIEGQRRAA
jgi:CheY-like chemotaxis protein